MIKFNIVHDKKKKLVRTKKKGNLLKALENQQQMSHIMVSSESIPLDTEIKQRILAVTVSVHRPGNTSQCIKARKTWRGGDAGYRGSCICIWSLWLITSLLMYRAKS